MIYQTTVSLVWFFYRTDWLSLLRFESWVRLRHFSLLFDLLTNWAISQNVHSKLSLVIFFVILCENSCPLICSVLPKYHTTVIIVSAWLISQILHPVDLHWFFEISSVTGQFFHFKIFSFRIWKFHFSSNLIFVGYTGSKNPVWTGKISVSLYWNFFFSSYWNFFQF